MKVKGELENIVLTMFFQFRNPQRLHAETQFYQIGYDIVRPHKRL